MSLANIEAKIDKIIQSAGGKSTSTATPKTQEELDEDRLKEIEAKLTDLTELIQRNVTRESIDGEIKSHRERVESTTGETRPYTQIYHEHKTSNKKIKTTRRTSAKMHLAEALKTRLRVLKHPKDLEHALHILVKEQLEILERQNSKSDEKR